MWVELVVFLITTTLYLSLRFRRWNNKSPLPPGGPRCLPLLGNLWQVWRHGGGLRGGNLYLALHKMSQKFGPIYTFTLDGRDIVVLSGWGVVSEWKAWLLKHPSEQNLETIPGCMANKLSNIDTLILHPILLQFVAKIRSEMGDGMQMIGYSHTLLHPSIMAALWVLSSPPSTTPNTPPPPFPLSEEEEGMLDLLTPNLFDGQSQGPRIRQILQKDAPHPGNHLKKNNLDNFTALMEDEGGRGGQYLNGGWATVAWALLYLTLHPLVQDKMVAEIQTNVRDEGPLEIVVRLRHKQRLPYCGAVVLEVQRLASVRPLMTPPTKVNGGNGGGDEVLQLGGFTIPQNTPILVDLYSLHRSPQEFPAPEDFSPQRHLRNHHPLPELSQYFDINVPVRREENDDRRTMHNVQDLVSDAVFMIVTTLVKNFVFSTVPGHLDPGTEAVPMPGPLLAPKPFNFVITKRIT